MRRGLGLDPSTYFTRRRESYFFDYVKDELIKEYGAKTVRLGGLQVRTTVDLKKQQEARAAIAERLGDIGPSSAIVTINPKNGYIEAMASSADYGESKFNLAAQGHRQPGSTFKVMALMAALRAGVDPDATHYTSKSPTKFDDPTYGPIDVSTYADSSARQHQPAQGDAALGQLGLHPARARRRARQGQAGRVGPRHPLQAQRLPGRDARRPRPTASRRWRWPTPTRRSPPAAMRNRPTAITRVTFPDGRKELPGALEGQAHEGVRGRRDRQGDRDPRAEHARAAPAPRRAIGCPAAGKTGTTDEFTDAWFVGFTPRLATAVWVGYPNDRTQMLGLYYGANVAGGTFPAEIWDSYMKRGQGQVLRRLPAAQDAVPRRSRSSAATRPAAAARATRPRAPTTPRPRPRRDATTPAPDDAATPTPDDTGDDHGRTPAAATARASTPRSTRRRPQAPPGNGDGTRQRDGDGGGTQAPG